jgi:hypothetical protein
MLKPHSKKFLLGLLITISSNSHTAELHYNFNSPSFSGIGFSSHVLTIKQLEDQAKEKNQAKVEALESKAERDAANTPQAQFVANLQSRIYAQLAKQITDTLFGATGQPNCSGSSCAGTVDVANNNVSWVLTPDGKNISVTIRNISNPSEFTTMTVPVGTFAF